MNRLVRVALAAVIAATTLLAPPGPLAAPMALANCPGVNETHYAWGNQSLSIQLSGVTGNIEWTQGNVCSSGVSHSVTLCATGSCARWAQAGWRYYSGYAEPKGYCEWGGTKYKLVEFAVTHATHQYKMVFDPVDDVWRCYRDTSWRYLWTEADAGFNSGTYLNAQGEAHQRHVQIGEMAPAKLLFSSMAYQRESDSLWATMNVALQPVDDPYGRDEPAAGQMRVWTNAH